MRELGPEVWEVTPADVALPRRKRESHKGDYGRVCILGGSVGYTGAPILAARAAVRTGAGLVTLLTPQPVWPIAAAKLDCAMPWPLPAQEGALSIEALEPAREELSTADAALIGPGLGRREGTAQVVRALASALACPLVLDADGINALEGHIDVLDARRDRLTVLTPHDGEFARVGGDLKSGDRVGAARAFAVAHGCVLVLKGHRTVTAFPNGRVYVNTTGNPGMAKGGSGDVLAGMIVSLLAQGFEPQKAAPWAVCLHGGAGDKAAEKLGEYAMTPLDLLACLPLVLKEAERRGMEGTKPEKTEE